MLRHLFFLPAVCEINPVVSQVNLFVLHHGQNHEGHEAGQQGHEGQEGNGQARPVDGGMQMKGFILNCY